MLSASALIDALLSSASPSSERDPLHTYLYALQVWQKGCYNSSVTDPARVPAAMLRQLQSIWAALISYDSALYERIAHARDHSTDDQGWLQLCYGTLLYSIFTHLYSQDFHSLTTLYQHSFQSCWQQLPSALQNASMKNVFLQIQQLAQKESQQQQTMTMTA